MTPMGTLQGRRILVIEDDYFIARDMAKHLKESGAEIVGPVGSIEDALDIIGAAEPLDGAILDINLGGEMAFPVADALRQRRVVRRRNHSGPLQCREAMRKTGRSLENCLGAVRVGGPLPT
jgi:CheY-like chemotaxis protein